MDKLVYKLFQTHIIPAEWYSVCYDFEKSLLGGFVVFPAQPPTLMEDEIENYKWLKKAYDRFGTFDPHFNKHTEKSWDLEERKRNPDVQHNKKKLLYNHNQKCPCCNLNAHKLHNLHQKFKPIHRCPYWACGHSRNVNRRLCWTGWEKCDQFQIELIKKI